VEPRAVLGAVVKRKIPSPRRESNPRTPIVQPVAQFKLIHQTSRVTEVSHFKLHKNMSKNSEDIGEDGAKR
jgi:hypothetical protein